MIGNTHHAAQRSRDERAASDNAGIPLSENYPLA